MSEDIPGYRAIHWEPLDVISDESMNRMSANIQAIHDYTPRALWSEPGNRHNKSIKIASGRKMIPSQKGSEATAEVNFGFFFSSGVKPNVTIGINAKQQQNLYCTFSGLPGTGLLPNSNGFLIHLQVAKEDGEKKKIARNVWIHWQAMGY